MGAAVSTTFACLLSTAGRRWSVSPGGHEPRNFARRQSAGDVSDDRVSGRGILVCASRLCGHLAYKVRGQWLDDKDQGLYGAVFAHVGSCDNPNFRGPGLAIATLNEWVIDYMSKKKMIQPGKVIVVGQSGGGWGSIALASRNPSSVQAIITFAAGRGGRVDGKPNNNCAPDKLVAATGEFGRTARIPMLWIYAENDTYFGPELTKRMHQAFVEAGGNVEYHVLPPFGSDGHFMIDSADAVPIWSPLVTQFLEKHSATATPPGQQVSSSSPQQELRRGRRDCGCLKTFNTQPGKNFVSTHPMGPSYAERHHPARTTSIRYWCVST